MHSKKQRILHLEATTRRRRNDLRREFNIRLLQTAMSAGGKRGRKDTSNQVSKRPKVDAPRIFRLPKDIQFRILGDLDECQDIFNTIKAMPTFPTFTETQWKTLKDKIDCPAFDKLELVETITEDEGQYTRVDSFYPRNQEGVDQRVRDAANDFATKCLFHRLYNTYKGDGMKKNGTAHFSSGGETKTIMMPKRMPKAFSYILPM